MYRPGLQTRLMPLLWAGALLSATASLATVFAAEPIPLQLETKIPLGEVRGRIDNMAIDLARQHLFVAELSNDSVAVVDLGEHKVVHVITGLKLPQGVGYVPSSDNAPPLGTMVQQPRRWASPRQRPAVCR